MFWQILVTIGAVPVCALVLQFLVVLIVRPATPAYSLDAITSALGAGVAVGKLDVKIADPPSPSQRNQHDRALGLALADRLSVEPSAVRVVVEKPSRLIDWQSSHASEQVRVSNEARHTVSAMEEMPEQIVGGFTAALRLKDGNWRVVRPSSHGVESWQYLPWLASIALLAAAIVSIAVRCGR